MDREEFLQYMGDQYDKLVELNKTKGADYAGDDDVLRNFKAHAERLSLRPEQIWAVYAGKHWDAVMTYCARGQVESEPIDGRIQDLTLYCFLLGAMVLEAETCQHDMGSGMRCELPAGHGGPHTI